MPSVAFHPFEGYVPPSDDTVNFLNQFKVLDRLLIGFHPTALLPPVHPLRDHVDRILRIGQDMELTVSKPSSFRGLQQLKNSGEFTQIVRPRFPATGIPASGVNDPRPAGGTRIPK